MSTKKNSHAVALGKLGGKAISEALTPEQRTEKARKAGIVGAQARKEALTPEQRIAIAKKAAKARWKNKKGRRENVE